MYFVSELLYTKIIVIQIKDQSSLLPIKLKIVSFYVQNVYSIVSKQKLMSKNGANFHRLRNCL